MLKLSTPSSLSTITNFNLSKSAFYPISISISIIKANHTNFQSQHAIYPRHSPLAAFDLSMQKIHFIPHQWLKQSTSSPLCAITIFSLSKYKASTSCFLFAFAIPSSYLINQSGTPLVFLLDYTNSLPSFDPN